MRSAYVSTEAIGDGEGAVIGALMYVGAGLLMGPVAAAGGTLAAIIGAAALGGSAGGLIGTWLAGALATTTPNGSASTSIMAACSFGCEPGMMQGKPSPFAFLSAIQERTCMSTNLQTDAGPAITASVLGKALLGSPSDAVVATDAEGIIRFWNPGAERIFGHTGSEAIGQSLDIIIPDRLRERHWAGYRQVMATGESRYGHGDVLAVPGIRKDGTRVSLEFTIVPLRDGGGAMIGWPPSCAMSPPASRN